jgi:hypothetical protein
MSSDPLSNFGDESVTNGRSEYDWGSAKPLGADTTDYSDDPRVAIGAGWVSPAGFNEIVELARDGRRSNDLFCHVVTPSRRNSPSRPMRVRAKHLLEQDNSGAITLLAPEQFQADLERDTEVRERLANGDEHLGATWFDGELVDVREYDDDGELIEETDMRSE